MRESAKERARERVSVMMGMWVFASAYHVDFASSLSGALRAEGSLPGKACEREALNWPKSCRFGIG